MSRAYTKEEVREQLIRHLLMLARYWRDTKVEGGQDRFEGLIHSILATLDGCSTGIPAFDLVPAPHPDDKEFHISNGENWYEPEVINDHTSLHYTYGQLRSK